MRPNLCRRAPRTLEHRIDLASNGICIAIEGDDLGKVERVARRVRAVMDEQQAAETLRCQARGAAA